MEKNVFRIVAVVLMAWVLSMCQSAEDIISESEDIRIAILPGESDVQIKKKYSAFLTYLEKETGLNFKLVFPESYRDMLNLFRDKKLDLVNFGGVTFYLANSESNAEPLVMRDIDTRFTSYILVRTQSPGEKIEDFKNRKLTFGSRISTSGHIMPRFYLQSMGIIPEKFFSEVLYSGRHDKTVFMVRDGEADVGVADSLVVDQMFRNGRLKKEEVKILWESSPFPDYVWTIQRDVSNARKKTIRDAFLKFNANNEKHREIMNKLGGKYYLPASVEDFKQIAVAMGRN